MFNLISFSDFYILAHKQGWGEFHHNVIKLYGGYYFVELVLELS